MRGHSLERCSQKSIPIPGSQLCSWNTCRELYRQVSNFVGSVASPVLANLALDGLEHRLKEQFSTPHGETADRRKVHMVRYADDFIITGTSKELLEGEVKPFVEQFMKERGLELSQEKTVVTCVDNGFDFLESIPLLAYGPRCAP
jgi:retron-type reverse transcriptase